MDEQVKTKSSIAPKARRSISHLNWLNQSEANVNADSALAYRDNLQIVTFKTGAKGSKHFSVLKHVYAFENVMWKTYKRTSNYLAVKIYGPRIIYNMCVKLTS